MTEKFKELMELCRSGQIQVQVDSRKVARGDIFVAVPGENQDGANFMLDAAKNGADFIVGLPDLPIRESLPPSCKYVGHSDPRLAVAELAKARWNTENLPIKIIGVTGTNGKTTTVFLLEHLFTALGYKVGVLGTITWHWPGYSMPAPLTTPDALQLHGMIARMHEAGVGIIVMEVSSHSLSQKRVDGIEFSGAIFTNLTQDHLDFHKDMDCYFRAKARLFLSLPRKDKFVAINYDDRHGRRLNELLPDSVSFGLHKGMPGQNHLWGQITGVSPAGMNIAMQYKNRQWQLSTKLVGEFNASNLLGVQALALQYGVDPDKLKILDGFNGVCGRLERVENSKGLNIFVDYAHTPDALANALRALRGVGFKRLVTVFGCGGNRDRTKRPLMGKAVAENSDIAILTSDNPRFEDPEAIMQDVKPGLARAREVYYEVNRHDATARAIDLLTPEDALLIAGKGHENYQIIGSEKRHYSDQEVVRELLGCN